VSEFSAWQDVLIELARIRGWLECWESTGQHQDERDGAIMRDRLARIEAIKPCDRCCNGWVNAVNPGEGPVQCEFCVGTGIAPKKEEEG